MKTYKEFMLENMADKHEFVKQKLADHDIDVVSTVDKGEGGTRLYIRDAEDQPKANEVLRNHGLHKKYHVATHTDSAPSVARTITPSDTHKWSGD